MTTLVIVLSVMAAVNDLHPGWIAGIGSLVGGIGLKVTEKWLNKNAEYRNDKQDYRSEIKELQERLDKVEQEVDDWRGRYYAQQEHILVLKSMMIGAGLNPPDQKTL